MVDLKSPCLSVWNAVLPVYLFTNLRSDMAMFTRSAWGTNIRCCRRGEHVARRELGVGQCGVRWIES